MNAAPARPELFKYFGPASKTLAASSDVAFISCFRFLRRSLRQIHSHFSSLLCRRGCFSFSSALITEKQRRNCIIKTLNLVAAMLVDKSLRFQGVKDMQLFESFRYCNIILIDKNLCTRFLHKNHTNEILKSLPQVNIFFFYPHSMAFNCEKTHMIQF